MSNEIGKSVLLELLKTKSGHKQDVFVNIQAAFKMFKTELSECVNELRAQLDDPRIRVKFVDMGDSEAQLFIGSDVLVFLMHSNVFKLPDTDYASQTSYVSKKPVNAYCGVIRVYDFLADSYEYNRFGDVGYMICRIFINSENHFKIEGEGQLGFVYQNFMNQVLSKELINEIILRIAIYALDFDLLTPPYQTVNEVSVGELQTLSSNSKLKTGKRLGFQFHSETDIKI